MINSGPEYLMKIPLLISAGLTGFLFHASAFEPPANSELIVDETFESAEPGKGWATQTGSWTVIDGALHGAEIAEDNHAAAARRIVETGDAVYELKFRFNEGAKAFHFGFDPKRGELDKHGHLFSVIITPGNWKILKHVDKDKPKEDPNETLATADASFETGKWYTLRVVTQNTSVKATIEGLASLEAEHPSFSVRKPTLVFRVSGDGVDVDDIKVWSSRS